MPSKRIAIAVAIVVVALIVLARAGSVLVAWQWFLSLGYVGVFSTIFTTRAVLFFAVFALSTGALWISGGLALRFARQSAPWLNLPPGSPLQLLGSSQRFPWRVFVGGAAVVLGLMIAATELSSWELALLFLHGVPYGLSDPVFGHDIGFYLFTLPAYVEIKNWLLLLLFFSAVVAGGVYWARGDIEIGIVRVGEKSLHYEFEVRSGEIVAATGTLVITLAAADSPNAEPWPDDVRKVLSGSG